MDDDDTISDWNLSKSCLCNKRQNLDTSLELVVGWLFAAPFYASLAIVQPAKERFTRGSPAITSEMGAYWKGGSTSGNPPKGEGS